MPTATGSSSPPSGKSPTFGKLHLEFGAYRLSLESVAACLVELNGHPTTFIEALRQLLEAKAKPADEWPFGATRKFSAPNGTEHVLAVPETRGANQHGNGRSVGKRELFVSAGLKGSHYRRFEGEPDGCPQALKVGLGVGPDHLFSGGRTCLFSRTARREGVSAPMR